MWPGHSMTHRISAARSGRVPAGRYAPGWRAARGAARRTRHPAAGGPRSRGNGSGTPEPGPLRAGSPRRPSLPPGPDRAWWRPVARNRRSWPCADAGFREPAGSGRTKGRPAAGRSPKDVYLYPLAKRCREILREGPQRRPKRRWAPAPDTPPDAGFVDLCKGLIVHPRHHPARLPALPRRRPSRPVSCPLGH